MGEPTERQVRGATDGAAEGGNAIDDGDGRVCAGRAEETGDPVLGYAEPEMESVGAGENPECPALSLDVVSTDRRRSYMRVLLIVPYASS